jgi:hypothetical protein
LKKPSAVLSDSLTMQCRRFGRQIALDFAEAIPMWATPEQFARPCGHYDQEQEPMFESFHQKLSFNPS